jgi:hypothetical protein
MQAHRWCSSCKADQAQDPLIAKYECYMSSSFKVALLGLSGKHTVWYEPCYLYPNPQTSIGRGWKKKMAEGNGDIEGRRLMQSYRMREGVTLLSYRPCTADESEAPAAGKLDTRSESRQDMLDNWMTSVVMIGLFCTCFTPIQEVTSVDGQTDCYNTLYCYSAVRLYGHRSKSQQLWLLCSSLLYIEHETCSDELLVAWFFQVQQILSKTRVGFNRDQRHLWMFSIIYVDQIKDI